MSKTFKLTGWKAVAALLVIVGLLGFRFYTRAATLNTEASEVLRTWLVAEYARDVLASIPPEAASDPAEQQAIAEELLSQQKVEVRDIRARGRGDTIYVRVEIAVDRRKPADGRDVRYYMMSHSLLIGWRMLRETHAFRYYLHL
jgi:hypothetical protein